MSKMLRSYLSKRLAVVDAAPLKCDGFSLLFPVFIGSTKGIWMTSQSLKPYSYEIVKVTVVNAAHCKCFHPELLTVANFSTL
jgi:hypothetical protein